MSIFSEVLTNVMHFSHVIKSSPPTSARRCAFDIGSGKIKMQLSQVDLKLNRITQEIFHDIAELPFVEDLATSKDGRLSEKVKLQAVDTLLLMYQKAKENGAESFAGVATEFVRQAENGIEFLQHIQEATSIPLFAISQQEEGRLSFISASATCKIDPDNTVVWDSGSGSFQITAKIEDHYQTFCSHLGKVAMKNMLLNLQGKKSAGKTPNPVGREDVKNALKLIKVKLQKFPKTLKTKLQQPHVVVLKMGTHPLAGYPMDYDYNVISQKLQSCLGLNDEEIKAQEENSLRHKELSVDPSFVVPNLVIALGVMEQLGIKYARYCGLSGGNTSGILLSAKYWE